MALRAAIFLDKDGTVLQDEPYNVDPQKMRLAPGAREGLANLAALELPLIVVSNQPGIALGKFGFDGLRRMQRQLAHMFREAGAELAGFHFCPHHPAGAVAAHARVCACRKPAPGLLLAAARRHGINLTRSWMIGDILDDVEAGQRAGCTTVLIDNGNETQWLMSPWREPDHRVHNLAQASRCVMDAMQRVQGVAP